MISIARQIYLWGNEGVTLMIKYTNYSGMRFVKLFLRAAFNVRQLYEIFSFYIQHNHRW